MVNTANEILDDIFDFSQNIVICGTAVGNTSASVKNYYADPNNLFWEMLFEVKLTPYQLKPYEYRSLKKYSVGLTDIAKNQHGTDNSIIFMKNQANELKKKILYYKPKVLCFNGKKAAQIFFDLKWVDYGLCNEKVGNTLLFVAPSTSGQARKYWDINYWHEVVKWIQ